MLLKINNNYIYLKILTILIFFTMGLYYIFTIPPLENFDEASHLSSIRQIYYEKQIPFKGNGFFDSELKNYLGPVPYSSGLPPFAAGDEFGYLTYKNFFNDENISEFKKKYIEVPFDIKYSKSEITNVQSQHPPLYYGILAFFYSAVEEFSLKNQILILRIISLFLSTISIFVIFKTFTTKWNNQFFGAKLEEKDVVVNLSFAFLFYFTLAPMCFVEFSRIGNDSLCILIVSLIAYFSDDFFNFKKKWSLNIIFFVILFILGFYTKAFFYPILLSFILVYLVLVINNNEDFYKCIIRLVQIIFPIILFGSMWNFYHYVVYGDLTATYDSLRATNEGNSFSYSNLSYLSIARGFVMPLVTFIWAGTKSLIHINYLWYVAFILLFMIFILFGNIKNLIKGLSGRHLYLNIFLFITFYLSFVWYINLNIHFRGISSSPGWYLHILAPFFIILIFSNLYTIPIKLKKFFLGLVLLFFYLFNVYVYFFNIIIFSGFGYKNDNKSLSIFDDYKNIFDFDFLITIYERLSIVTNPLTGLAILMVSFVLIFYLYRLLLSYISK